METGNGMEKRANEVWRLNITQASAAFPVFTVSS